MNQTRNAAGFAPGLINLTEKIVIIADAFQGKISNVMSDNVLMSGRPRGGRTRPRWLTRRTVRRRRDVVGFVLSGGGPLGALQVGALRALLEAGVKPDLLCGASVGALNATGIAFEPSLDGVERLEQTWRRLATNGLLPARRFGFSWARFLARGNHVFDNAPMRALIRATVGDRRIEEAQLPVGIVATELNTGRERVFTSGDVTLPLLASTAMPGILPPVPIDGATYIDGGVANNVPIAPAIAMGATTVYVFDSTARNHARRPLERPIDYMTHAFSLARSQRAVIEKPLFARRVRLIQVPLPALDFYIPFTSLEHSARLMEMAHEVVARWVRQEFEGERVRIGAPTPAAVSSQG
jgi:NTE family protein